MPRVRLSTAFLTSIGLAAFVGVIGYFHQVPTWLLLPKVMFAPVFVLASLGLDQLFPAEEAISRSWSKELARYLANGFLLASFVLITVTTKPDATLIDMLETLAVFLAVYVPTMAALFWRQHGRSKTPHHNVTDM
ncbi:hypothetical protein [Rhizobium oryzicola]|uniref:Uncharacterized protein n=1 Tax=Rhizobium oryzicola TaxID=1232668 RepID=A0ABT8SQR4_9HYPH|nr:hypothetical protein [Rhizobium oryzicola]MDO1580595.1 hypothetical protein [Rhizobium oryzicola]